MPASTIIGYPLSAFLIDSFGWEFVFYTQGVLVLIWCILWFTIISDTPQKFRWISEAEKNYIVESIGESITSDKVIIFQFNLTKLELS